MMMAMARVSRALVLYKRNTPRLSSRNTTRFLLAPTIFTSLLFPGALHRHIRQVSKDPYAL